MAHQIIDLTVMDQGAPVIEGQREDRLAQQIRREERHARVDVEDWRTNSVGGGQEDESDVDIDDSDVDRNYNPFEDHDNNSGQGRSGARKTAKKYKPSTPIKANRGMSSVSTSSPQRRRATGGPRSPASGNKFVSTGEVRLALLENVLSQVQTTKINFAKVAEETGQDPKKIAKVGHRGFLRISV